MHSKKLESFAQSMKPFFLRYEIIEEQTVSPHSFGKNAIILYLNEDNDKNENHKTLSFDTLPNENVIDKVLGVEILNVKEAEYQSKQ